MTAEVKAFLSGYETTTIFHLKDLASGKRKILKTTDVSYYEAPHYEGLSVDDMLEFAKQYSEVRWYLPAEKREIKKLPRDYVASLLYSIIGKPFDAWVQRRIEERNEKIAEEKDMNAELDPDVYDAYVNSSSISGKYPYIFPYCLVYSTKGKFAQSLQVFLEAKKNKS